MYLYGRLGLIENRPMIRPHGVRFNRDPNGANKIIARVTSLYLADRDNDLIARHEHAALRAHVSR